MTNQATTRPMPLQQVAKLKLNPATRERLEAELLRRGVELPVRRQSTSKRKPIWQPRPENIPQQQAFASEADEIYYGGAAGGGKMLELGTMIPTPSGWKTMGELVAGDEIFDENGKVCRVVVAHPVEEKPISFRLTFDDGTEIDACADHKWLTFDEKELAAITRLDPEWRKRRQEKRPTRAGSLKSETFRAALVARNKAREYSYKPRPAGTVRTTAEIAATVKTARGRTNHAVPIAGPLQLPHADLPLDPYCLGAWLGDGSSRNGQFTGIDPEIWQNFEANGFEVRHYSEKQHCVIGLQTVLRALGVLRNKHVPTAYLRASASQRLALLQGLMDTDGTVTDGGAVEFTNTNKALADAVLELIVSLGWKARMVTGRASCNGKDCGEKYDIKWTPSEYVFRLGRKRDRQILATRRTTKFRYIVSCEPIDPKPMRCITVDSPSHLYLAGHSMVPTHNSDYAIGMAIEKHTKSIIFRREYEQLKDLIARSKELLEGHARYNENTKMWRGIHGNKSIEFGGMQREDDKKKFKGRPHDAKIFDELTEFSQSQFEFVIAWNRTTVPNQKCRIIATFNPPTDPEGEWIIRRLAPWLDRAHSNPAKPGELRWFIKKDDEDVEVPGPQPVEHNGELLQPKSRTFFPAMLEDNPDLRDTEYRAQLQSLPEPLRSQLLFGNFQATAKDHPRQVIPTEWVLRAQKRWRERRKAENFKPPSTPMTALGVDVSRGGKDRSVIAPRYDNVITQLFVYQGEETKDGGMVATLVLNHHEDNALISMDALGVGTSPYDILNATPGISVNGINSSDGSSYRDKSGRYKMFNRRAELWWRLREALDPRSGEAIELPDDRELLADLCAPRFEVQKSGIKIELKEAIKARIGRSPDKGEAVVYAFDDAGAIEFFSL